MKHALDPRRIAGMRATLRARQSALRDEIREDLRKSDDDRARLYADRVHDVEDESVADLLVDLDLAEIDRDLGELREVEAALGRIDQGSYGSCATCDGPIGEERLEANPAALRCLGCQAMHEKTYAHPGTPTL
jgi:RNA polymerase-binding protein DksA